MKVPVAWDEIYPVFSVEAQPQLWTVQIDMTDAEVKDFAEVEERWQAWQQTLSRLVRAERAS